MLTFAARRVLVAVPTTLGVCTVLFFALHLAPGDPADRFLDPEFPTDIREVMSRNLGLDQPVPVQYLRWLSALLRLDLGHSFHQGRPVSTILAEAIPNTAVLCGTALVLMFGIGTAIGVVSALRKGSLVDGALTLTSLVLYSIPGFWLALMAILLFAYAFPILPASSVTSVGYEFLGPWAKLWDRALHLVLPALALGVAPSAGVARYVRAAMVEALGADFVRAARARGLSSVRVVLRHALRNAALPLVTLLGLYLPYLFGGSVLIETVFGWPGMGRLMVDAIGQQDFPVVLGGGVLYTFAVIGGNLLADLLYAAVDPRTREV